MLASNANQVSLSESISFLSFEENYLGHWMFMRPKINISILLHLGMVADYRSHLDFELLTQPEQEVHRT